MNILKIILGLVVSLFGFGIAAAGVALIVWGTWNVWLNVAVGGALIFGGAGGFGLAGILIMLGTRTTEALGGIPTGLLTGRSIRK